VKTTEIIYSVEYIMRKCKCFLTLVNVIIVGDFQNKM